MANTKKSVEEIADLRIFDNWLDAEDFQKVKSLFYHEDTTWNIVPGISASDSTNAIKNPLNNYRFFVDVPAALRLRRKRGKRTQPKWRMRGIQNSHCSINNMIVQRSTSE